jgi:hypothetical protein
MTRRQRILLGLGAFAVVALVIQSERRDNDTSDQWSTVVAGTHNTASSYAAAVVAGHHNIASGPNAFVGGGTNNVASEHDAFIGAGHENQAGFLAAVGGGHQNRATGYAATIPGGYDNIASGDHSTALGGLRNVAAGSFSVAAGWQARVDSAHGGSFLFADATNADFHSARQNEFAVRATGGSRLVTAVDTISGRPTAGVALPAGGGSWASLSDRAAKSDVCAVDAQQILDGVAALPIGTWSYRTQADDVRHIGPSAQDFHTAFGVGEDDRHITGVDADGVALAAIQGLLARLQRRDAEIDALQRRVVALEARLAD